MGADVVIVCATETEEAAVLQMGNRDRASWHEYAVSDDASTYLLADVTTESGHPLRIALARPASMGMAHAAVLTTKMIKLFEPNLVAMAGIAAGSDRAHQSPGDVLVATTTFDYESGKWQPSADGGAPVFRPDPQPLTVDDVVQNRVTAWSSSAHPIGMELYRRWTASNGRVRPSGIPAIRHGPLASGAAVLGDRTAIARTQTGWRKLIGIEMEAHGVHVAVSSARRPRPLFLCAKSICDFADTKSDDWQAYAAFTSAEFIYEFVRKEWSKLVPESDAKSSRAAPVAARVMLLPPGEGLVLDAIRKAVQPFGLSVVNLSSDTLCIRRYALELRVGLLVIGRVERTHEVDVSGGSSCVLGLPLMPVLESAFGFVGDTVVVRIETTLFLADGGVHAVSADSRSLVVKYRGIK
jgi:nucleoside phosphorylase